MALSVPTKKLNEAVSEKIKEAFRTVDGFEFYDNTLLDYTINLLTYEPPYQISKIGAILITGPSGVGKNAYAEAFAKVYEKIYQRDLIRLLIYLLFV